jgi:hypothetical protein
MIKVLMFISLLVHGLGGISSMIIPDKDMDEVVLFHYITDTPFEIEAL